MSEAGPQNMPMAMWPEVHTIAGVEEVLAELHKSYRLCVATNATMSHRPTVERALERGGLLKYFSSVFTFTDLGVKKESPAFWQAVTSELELAPHQIAMIGDSLEPDVLAPARAGIYSIWLNRGGSEIAQLGQVPAISELREAIPLIKNAT
jgi:putative hydrolase of the HAD superfamily